ncbi:MAG: hypothetical protein RIQ81_306 [Pseudomonadota bacterium]|jgi:hypothetical protein
MATSITNDPEAIRQKIVFFAYVALTCFLAFYHEPWRDEADSWLMVRNASLREILSISPDSGHPPLWYFLLKPLAASGLPYAAQPTLHLFIAWASAWLVIFRSPFPWQISASILFTYLFSFEYSVVARNYSLGIFGLFLYASASGSPGKRCSITRLAGIFVMSFASLFTLISAAILFCMESLQIHPRYRPTPRLILPGHCWAMGFAVLVSTLILMPTGKGQFSDVSFNRFIIQAPIDSLSTLLMPRQSYHPLYSAACGIWLLAAGFIAMRYDRRAALFLVFSVLAVFLMFTSIHYQIEAPRYGGMIYVFAVAAMWMALTSARQRTNDWKQNRALWGLFFVFGLAQFPDTLSVWWNEATLPFTDAGTVAIELQKAGGNDKIVVCSPPTNCESVLLRMPQEKKFLYPGIGFGTYGLWDKTHRAACLLSADRAIEWAKQFSGTGNIAPDGFIFISTAPLSNPESHGLRNLSFTASKAWAVQDETFHIYTTAD